MPVFDHLGRKVFTNEQLRWIGDALLDTPRPMRVTHPLVETIHAVMNQPENPVELPTQADAAPADAAPQAPAADGETQAGSTS